MHPKNKHTKLTLSEVENQMEVLTKEEMNQLKGGFYIIEDPSGIVSQLKSDLSARISSLESILCTVREGSTEIDFGGMSFQRRHIEETLNEYKATLREIKELEQAAEVYHFDYGSIAKTDQRGSVVYSTVPYENQDPGLVGHELKHQYQYHTGELIRGNNDSPIGYDIQDEVSAYRRQDIINNGVDYFKRKLERKVEDIRKMLDEKGSLLYPNL
ncbi:hypothetical protein [Capnocytophaga felis]|uniref:DUF4157 domain-containing protein n=1 Tax=Capnocytophaga felis TaxID=2267611 RepID=A0A5M4BDG6_9FLAO|nr:hypothetical protein [Capnocytophaga felis]GET47136.1 hypothetical protein RCZ01_24380 [Capnocytophaga felis]GET49645.1 hypothetical protein RCZ02_24760 [Capnocytophaga felis]